MISTTLHEVPEARYAQVAAEIARLANSDITADAFVKGLLEQTMAVLGARAAGLWGFSSQGVLALAGEKNLAEIGVTRDPAQSRLNVRRLLDVTVSRKTVLHDAGGEFRGQAIGAPVVMAPVATAQRCVGVFEVFWDRPLGSDEALDAQHFVETVCSSTAYFLAWREESYSTELIREFWDRFDQTTARLHGSLDLALVAMTAANEGRRLLNCDRLSLVIRNGSRTKVIAVSGQEQVNAASNLVRSLAELAALGIAANRELGTGDDISIPAGIEKAVLEHMQVGGARLVRVIPLRPPLPADASQPVAVPRAFAALVFEQFTEAWVSPLAADQLTRYASHVAGALHNAQTHHQIFLLPLRRAIGRIGAKMAAARL
jgi:hypothetical protein